MLCYKIILLVAANALNLTIWAQVPECLMPQTRNYEPDTLTFHIARIRDSQIQSLPFHVSYSKRIREGVPVRKGDTVLRLEKKFIDMRIAVLAMELETTQHRLSRMKVKPEIARLHSRLNRLRQEMLELKRYSRGGFFLTAPFDCKPYIESRKPENTTLVFRRYSPEFAEYSNSLKDVRFQDSIACFVIRDGEAISVDKKLLSTLPIKLPRTVAGQADTLVVKVVNLFRSSVKYFALEKPTKKGKIIDCYSPPDTRGMMPKTRCTVFDISQQRIRHVLYDYVYEDAKYIFIHSHTVNPNFCFMIK